MRAETRLRFSLSHQWPWKVAFLAVLACSALVSWGVLPAPFHLSLQTESLARILAEGALSAFAIAAAATHFARREFTLLAFVYLCCGLFFAADVFDRVAPMFHLSAYAINLVNGFALVVVAGGILALGTAGIVAGARTGRGATVALGATLLLLPPFFYALAVELRPR